MTAGWILVVSGLAVVVACAVHVMVECSVSLALSRRFRAAENQLGLAVGRCVEAQHRGQCAAADDQVKGGGL